jgi:hypothetical protein
LQIAPKFILATKKPGVKIIIADFINDGSASADKAVLTGYNRAWGTSAQALDRAAGVPLCRRFKRAI